MSCQFNVNFVGETFFSSETHVNCKVLSILTCDVTMLYAALEVGKLEIVNINLNKKFISLRKVITEHRHRTPQENLKAETKF